MRTKTNKLLQEICNTIENFAINFDFTIPGQLERLREFCHIVHKKDCASLIGNIGDLDPINCNCGAISVEDLENIKYLEKQRNDFKMLNKQMSELKDIIINYLI